MKFSKINILIFILVIVFNRKRVSADVAQVNCRDKFLDENCVCEYDKDSDLLLMKCQNPLDGASSKLPDIPAEKIVSLYSFLKWPKIPESYKKKADILILSQNRISAIGDLDNLEKLRYLNLSFNFIKRIDSSIAKLVELIILDVSSNLIETINFGDFIPNINKTTWTKNEQIFSKLQYLFLDGNQIKYIYKLDLMFIGMPFVNALFLDNNKIQTLDVNVSQQALNIISKANQAIVQNKTYMKTFVYFFKHFCFNLNSKTF
jgi:Leucine-rich repeat (LRR) protein